ncbi:hypothetical protein ACMHYB_37215 [Sorangium sp. So ce1128]
MKPLIVQPWKGVLAAGLSGALLALAGCAEPGAASRAAGIGTDTGAPAAAENGGEAPGEGSAEATATGGCLVTGCSGQVCAARPTMTTCEWTEAHACYSSHGICERDARGQCGWRRTPELDACLRPRAATTPGD